MLALWTYGHCINRTGTRIETALILRTRTLSDMGALDKRLYTSPHASTDTVVRVGPDRVNLARNGGMLQSEVRLSLSNCTQVRSYISNFVLEVKLLLYNHDGLHQLATGAYSSYDTAPASVFNGLPSLL